MTSDPPKCSGCGQIALERIVSTDGYICVACWTMTKNQIKVREDALKVLRLAREWVKAGCIRKGRTGIDDMALDAIEDAPNPPDWKRILSVPRPVESRVLAYLCLCIPGTGEPGSYSLRIKRIVRWNGRQYVTQDTIIRAFEAAVRLAIKDIRECKAAAKKAKERHGQHED